VGTICVGSPNRCFGLHAVESQFEVLDRLIQRFRATPAGRDMIAAWQASRVIRDLRHGPSSQAPPESPAPEAT
jgi:hypothetical protein